MDEKNFLELASKAHDLFTLSHAMQKLLQQMFFQEFLDWDQEEKTLSSLQDNLPF